MEGYYEATANGVVRGFGDAQLFGDTSQSRLKAPIVGIGQTDDDFGYWLVDLTAASFAFGDAPFWVEPAASC